ncbi:hypothetical protein LJY25_05830 [Hymenobacter sp. BT175]|uniref:hypothetical protein n=1 Tax=Hymenobacter translucens TaxID=2886507 RepID=UPI001D0DE433|nr:hypothetical protein [Hymenobacter translucens]MCC2545956.1 hypothetical protein [Hymenobacter translucens]
MAASLPAFTTLAQDAEVPAPKSAGRNILRVDLVNPVFENVINFDLFEDKPWAFPVLLSYERQLTRQTSLGGEILLNGGNSEQRRSGGSLQFRYYARPNSGPKPLSGFYVAPTVSYRKIQFFDAGIQPSGPYATVRAVGAGAYAGWQGGTETNRHGQRLVLDISAGLMGWLPKNSVPANERPAGEEYESRWISKRVAFDARIGVGVQF